jgi:hypothetical protein
MCYLIYGAFILTFAVFGHATVEQYGLAVPGGEGQWSVIALGWEMIPVLWPLFLLAAAVGSAATYLIVRPGDRAGSDWNARKPGQDV